MWGNAAGGVVVARYHEHGNVVPFQTSHPLGEKEPRVIILPVSVVEVPGQKHKTDLLFNGKGYQVVKGPAGGISDFIHGGVFIALQTP